MAQVIPNAGVQMQQIPTVPLLLNPTPKLDVVTPARNATPTTQGATFVAKRLNVSGAHAYTEAELVKVAGFVSGDEVSVQKLNDMAEQITQRYRKDGFLVARAYLPTQEIKDGVVTIAVLEGRYGEIKLNNTSTLDTQVPRYMLVGLNSGDVIATTPLEDRLLLLSDVPGVQVRSTLVPGASVGLSDLIVEVKPGALISGSIDADNAGNRYTGEERVGATINLNNPTGGGDLATLRAITSGSGLKYARAAYQRPVGLGRVGIAYSDLSYKLGEEFKALDANGHVRITTLFGSYPLIRSRNRNLNVGLTLDSKVFQDRLDAIPSVTDKRAQVATASIYGNSRDLLGAGGLNTYSLAWSTGKLDIQTEAARGFDAETANSNGHYNKLAFAMSRLQQATESISLYGSLSGQLASKNLDSSEKMELGGMYGVRAYPAGEAYADEGYLLTLEARKQLTLPQSVLGRVQLIAFVDAGAVKLSHSPWADGTQKRHLSGAGLGVHWTYANDYSLKAFYARKLGSENALSGPDKSGRFWVQAVKYF